MPFIILLILSAFSIAASAAFFSVFGLAKVFSGSFWSVVIMGSALEGGKLMAASFLYRYWTKIPKAMKAYGLAAVVGLMLITSSGIFGYLSAAYQSNVTPYQIQQQQIGVFQTQIEDDKRLLADRNARAKEINQQIAELPSNVVNGRRKLQSAFQPELDEITKDVKQYNEEIRANTTQIAKLQAEKLQETSHIGPILYIAEAFHVGADTATKWLILLIIFVFDPLAIMLTLGANIALTQRKNELEKQMEKQSQTTTIEPSTPVVPTLHIDNAKLIQPAGVGANNMMWINPAPHAAAPGPTGYFGQGVATGIESPFPFKGTFDYNNPKLTAAAQPNVTTYMVVGGAQPNPPPPAPVVQEEPTPVLPKEITEAFSLFTRTDLSPREIQMRTELRNQIKRYTEVIDAQQNLQPKKS
jgi:hypothetical protein